MTDASPSWVELDDERFHIPRPAVLDDIKPRAKPRRPIATEWKRMGFFIVGGAVALALLLILAEEINPPDSALAGQTPTSLLGAWEGTWVGNLVQYDLAGNRLASYDVTREYNQVSADVQTLTILRRGQDGSVETQLWVTNIGGVSELMITPQASNQQSQSFSGRLEDGRLIWSRIAGGKTETMRSWIHGRQLYVENLVMTGNPVESYVMSGSLTKR